MTPLTLLLAFLVGIVHLPGRVVPGIDGGIETQNDVVQIGESNTTGTVTFTLAADYDVAPTVVATGEIDAQSAGAAAATVDRVEVTARTADSVDVEVELSAAPGAGETTDVRVHALFGGSLNR